MHSLFIQLFQQFEKWDASLDRVHLVEQSSSQEVDIYPSLEFFTLLRVIALIMKFVISKRINK